MKTAIKPGAKILEPDYGSSMFFYNITTGSTNNTNTIFVFLMLQKNIIGIFMLLVFVLQMISAVQIMQQLLTHQLTEEPITGVTDNGFSLYIDNADFTETTIFGQNFSQLHPCFMCRHLCLAGAIKVPVNHAASVVAQPPDCLQLQATLIFFTWVS